ncbi:hypothetical protein IF1G_01526 [Cordyceps javanica]|uniref:Uncharacterized protein n=1 Tax=Cordyceps javanica TaxID=43265 RepID=A0A545VC53_9HYPO|nr:hypothetical protein IF1G_01526 [Cordyceps javanica]
MPARRLVEGCEQDLELIYPWCIMMDMYRASNPYMLNDLPLVPPCPACSFKANYNKETPPALNNNYKINKTGCSRPKHDLTTRRSNSLSLTDATLAVSRHRRPPPTQWILGSPKWAGLLGARQHYSPGRGPLLVEMNY